MHFALQFLPIFYALGAVYFLQSCCPGTTPTTYSWFNCACPAAQFTWAQSRKQGQLCGYPELTVPSSPPVYYKTLTWNGGMVQVVNYPPNHVTGTAGPGGGTFFGVSIPANADYDLTANQYETWTNTVTGTDSMSPPDMSTETNGLTTTPCAETQGAVMSGYATLTTVVTGSINDPITGIHAIDQTTTAPYGPGSWSYLASSTELLWGSLIDVYHVPFGGAPTIGSDGSAPGGMTSAVVSATKQAFFGSGDITGEIDQVLSDAVDEAAVLGAQTAESVTFDGGEMGGAGGWNAQSGASDYPSSATGGGLPGSGIDWCGPAWADRVASGPGNAGRMMDQISAATFGINVSNLVAGVPMKCTVQVYRAAYSVDVGNPLFPIFGSASPVGSPIVFTFTPGGDTYTIGPGENVISGAAPQGWIYGAKILAVEPQ